MNGNSVSSLLLTRLKSDDQIGHLIKPDAVCKRLYSSPSSRNAGAWSWEVSNNGSVVIGSKWSMGECLKAPFISIYQDPHIFTFDVFPEQVKDDEWHNYES